MAGATLTLLMFLNPNKMNHPMLKVFVVPKVNFFPVMYVFTCQMVSYLYIWRALENTVICFSIIVTFIFVKISGN